MGRTLTGTPNHPVRLRDNLLAAGWRNLGSLQPGDEIQLRPPRFAEERWAHVWRPLPGMACRVEVDEDWALFLGYFMGDGSYYKGQVDVACDGKDEDVAAEVQHLLERLFGHSRRKEVRRVQGRRGAIVVSYGSAHENTGRPTATFEVLDALSVVYRRPNGRYRRRVCVPEAIWRSPRDLVALFLSALFESDGTARPTPRLSTSHEQFARDVQLLLLGFGINVPVQRVYHSWRNGTKKTHVGWVLPLTRHCASVFIEEIGFRSQRKRAESLQPPATTVGRPRHALEMVDVVKEVATLQDRETVYDFTVEGHAFSAGGILTHNSVSAAFTARSVSAFDPNAVAFYRRMVRDREKEGPPIVGVLRRDNNRRVVFTPTPGGWLTVWKPPRPGYVDYVIGSDSSLAADAEEHEHYGRTSHDWCAAVVLDWHKEQQAEIRTKLLDPFNFADALCLAGEWYRFALINPETMALGGGYAVQHRLKENNYPRIALWKRWDARTQKYTKFIGFDVTAKSGPIHLGKLLWESRYGAGLVPKELLAKEKEPPPRLKIYSRQIVAEMTTYTVHGAMPGCHDDLVFSLGLALLGLEQMGKPARRLEVWGEGRVPEWREIERHVRNVEGGEEMPGWMAV